MQGGEGVVRNVSASGIYFVTEVALQEGQPVQLSMQFDGFPSGPISVTCHARVVRVEGQGSRRGVAAAISGLEFYRAPVPREVSDKNG